MARERATKPYRNCIELDIVAAGVIGEDAQLADADDRQESNRPFPHWIEAEMETSCSELC